MTKLMIVLQLKAGEDRGTSLKYWAEVHGPLGAKLPGLRGYVQHHAVEGLGGDLPFFGIAELTFDSRADADAALGSPEMAAALEDAANFADVSVLWGAWTEDHVIV